MNFYFDLVKQFCKKYLLTILTISMLLSIIILDVYHIFFQNKTCSFNSHESNIALIEKENNNSNTISDSSNNVTNGNSLEANTDLQDGKTSEAPKYYIDIKGSVKNPGVYEVTADNIVNDCIKKAGGLLKNADTTTINLSKKVSSEMVIYIPKKDEVIKTTTNTTVTKNQEIPNDAAVSDSNQSTSKDNSTIQTPSSTLININTATVEELTSLSGIGSAKAQDIIDYRINNGKFQTIEDIQKVSGIGEALYAKIKDYITV